MKSRGVLPCSHGDRGRTTHPGLSGGDGPHRHGCSCVGRGTLRTVHPGWDIGDARLRCGAGSGRPAGGRRLRSTRSPSLACFPRPPHRPEPAGRPGRTAPGPEGGRPTRPSCFPYRYKRRHGRRTRGLAAGGTGHGSAYRRAPRAGRPLSDARRPPSRSRHRAGHPPPAGFTGDVFRPAPSLTQWGTAPFCLSPCVRVWTEITSLWLLLLHRWRVARLTDSENSSCARGSCRVRI